MNNFIVISIIAGTGILSVIGLRVFLEIMYTIGKIINYFTKVLKNNGNN